ncbi:MAG: hypothetical protein WDO74_11855 [Pseudomonadota bacterium]
MTASIALSAAALGSVSSAADAPDATHRGRSSVYGNLKNASLEAVSTPNAMLSLIKAPDSAAPTRDLDHARAWRARGVHGLHPICLEDALRLQPEDA